MNSTENSAFLREIERQMDAKGIDSLEELHQRFLEQEPERIGSASEAWTFELFRGYATHEVKGLSEEFLVALAGALEATTDEERQGLVRAWFEDVWFQTSTTESGGRNV
jgi:hypothetical protein